MKNLKITTSVELVREKYKDYLDTFLYENSKIASTMLIRNLEDYMNKSKIEKIEDMQDYNIDSFMISILTGKSSTTISNTISRIKHLFRYYGKDEIVKHLSLKYIKSITNSREDKFLTPYEMYNLIESLINYQDKALVLLCYMGLYDINFETIRHLKRENLKKDKLIIDDEREIKLNYYCSEILNRAIKEEEMEKYVFQEGRKAKPYKINVDSPYIITSKIRNGGATETIPAITLKKKFELYGKYSGVEKFSPIMVKNSRFIYDLVRLEFEENYGVDINQEELKNYCREEGKSCQIEKINMAKKDMKLRIINDIITGKTFFID